MFHWSARAPHILSLFAPWTSDNGYPAESISTAEALLDIHFPLLLRSFYQAWGNYTKLTRQVNALLSPVELFVETDTLIFCAENQGVWYWGIPCSALHEDDPPVVIAQNEDQDLVWQPSHDHLSDFFDYLTYGHALAGGALHGAYSEEWSDESIVLPLQHRCDKLMLPSYPDGFVPDLSLRPWSLYVGEGFVVDGAARVAIAARTMELVEEIGDIL